MSRSGKRAAGTTPGSPGGAAAAGTTVTPGPATDLPSGGMGRRLMDLLAERKPKSLEICALLHKHVATELRHPVRFVGFDAPNEFLVGYGLDHAESFRHVPYIASLQ